MAQIESIDDVMARKGSIAHLWKIIDPENRFSYATCLEEWYRICHPYPTNWNGRPLINRLIKENKMVRAYYNGSYGIYTLDEARVWQMTDVKPLN